MNPFIEVASRWPARIGCCCAAGLALVLSLLVFFAVVPPVLSLPGHEPVSFNLIVLMQEFWAIGHRADCGQGARVEVPAIGREEPGPADHLT